VSRPVDPARFLARLRHVAEHFPLEPGELDALSARGSGPLLLRLAQIARQTHGTELTWLLLVCVTMTFPVSAEFKRAHRRLRVSPPGLEHRAFLEAGVRSPDGLLLADADLEIVTGATVVDVDFCAKHEHNTGIQRVVRQTMSRWGRDRDIVPVAWTDGSEAMRRLTPRELSRVVDYAADPRPPVQKQRARLVVPFRSSVVLLEVPPEVLCDPLESLAELSGNSVGILGYDAIPVVSADTVPGPETDRFVKYLSVVKHSDRVVGISAAATAEFQGFVDAVSAQGLTGPVTSSVPLPVDIPDSIPVGTSGAQGPPLVLCVGSHEPRKNHRAVLFAATVLWREGIDFSLRFIGGGSAWYTRAFDREIARLTKQGHPVEVLRGVNDSMLLDSYARARFTVFPSLHEGYGLPVAESIALGVPAITSNYGSTAEIAADGGCLVVDPRDDDSLVDAMRLLLTDPAKLDRLRSEIRTRPRRTWDDYAAELWTTLVEPLAVTRG
jgi:glycosyltransferase involved in cell wall biosynthesis